MKVRVVLVVDVDDDAWREEYGDTTATDGDIREAVRSAIQTAAATDGVVAPSGIIRDVALWSRDR